MSEIAFHEKAGRSQENTSEFLFDMSFCLT